MRRTALAMVPIALVAGMIPAHSSPPLAPAARAAAQQIGSLPTSEIPQGCDPLAGVQSTVASGTRGYDALRAGILTSWRTVTGPGAGTRARLAVYRPAGAGSWTTVARSAVVELGSDQTNVYATRIAVRAGDTLGITVVAGSPVCWFPTGDAGDEWKLSAGVDPVPGSTFTPTGTISTGRLDLQATLEPDADRDGYGDVTQDRCPTQATAGRPCDRTAPRVRVTQKPPARTRERQAVVGFRVSGRTTKVTCSIDGGRFRSCNSPVIRTVGPGPHVFKVRAADRWGNVSRPALVRWRVTG